MTTQNQDEPGAQGSEGKLPTQATIASPKLELKDGSTYLDGHKVVRESDLIAAKESLQKQLDSAQKVHTVAIEKLQLDLSAAHQSVAEATAKLTQATQARQSGATSDQEVAKLKSDHETAKGELEKTNKVVLDYRRKLILNTYQIPVTSDAAKQLNEKDMKGLDSFEEAMKTVLASRSGIGNYAVGGSGGSTSPIAPIDRAKALLAATPYRGTRNTEVAKT